MVAEKHLLDTLWTDSVIGLAILDREGRFTKVNPALCKFLRLTEIELLGAHFKDVTHPQDYEADWKMVQLLLAGQGDVYDMVKRYITKLEGVEWAYLRVSALRDRDRNFLAFLSQISPAERAGEEGEAKTQSATGRWISWGTVRAAMPTVVLIAGAIGAVIAYVIQQLYGIEVPREK